MWVDTSRGRKSVSTARMRSSSSGWRQAGFSSFAYRLAHLTLPRPVTVAGAFFLFYLV
jgi:hypothetical protein